MSIKHIIYFILMTYNYVSGQDLTGKWLATNDGATYTIPTVPILEFDQNSVTIYNFNEFYLSAVYKLESNILLVNEKIWGNISFLNNDRFTLYQNGTTNGKDTIFSTDYVRLRSTETNLSKAAIEKSYFGLEWKQEKVIVVFSNQNPESINLEKEGEKMLLESIESTLFISFYIQGKRHSVLPIEVISTDFIKIYGFPAKPYTVSANINFH